MDLNFVKKSPALFQEIGLSTGTDATETKMETPMFMMEVANIDNYTVSTLKVAGVDLLQVNVTTEMPVDLILGCNTPINADWLCDFPLKNGLNQNYFRLKTRSVIGRALNKRLCCAIGKD